MSLQEHASAPDWLVEACLAIFILAIVIMAAIAVVNRLRRGPNKAVRPKAKLRFKRKRSKGRQ